MSAMIDVIKYDNDDETLVYKYPVEDFSTKSQLVVQQSQMAIFYYKGEKADVFTEPGTYTLSTQNIPILRHLVNLPFGGNSPFHAAVYFVDQAEAMQMKWGTSEKVGIIEPTYMFPMKIGACGELSIKIVDCELLMEKIVGSKSLLTRNQYIDNMRAILQTKVKTCLAQVFQGNNLNIFTIETELERLSKLVKEKLAPGFSEYGVSLENFWITNIARPEEDPNYQAYHQMFFERGAGMETIRIQNQQERMRREFEFEMQMRAQDIAARGVVVDSRAQAEKRRIEGYDYATERAYNVAEMTAQNEGAGNFAAAGMGVGIGMGIGGAAAQTVGSMYNDALSSINMTVTPNQEQDMGLGMGMDSNDFYGNVGLDNIFAEVNEQPQMPQETVADSGKTRMERLKELKEYFDMGLITEAEFENKKKEILDQI